MTDNKYLSATPQLLTWVEYSIEIW